MGSALRGAGRDRSHIRRGTHIHVAREDAKHIRLEDRRRDERWGQMRSRLDEWHEGLSRDFDSRSAGHSRQKTRGSGD